MSNETTIFYKKEKDGTYTAIQEYDSNFRDSMPFGIHMVYAEQIYQTRIYNLNPEDIGLWASAYLLRNKLEKVVEDIYHPGVIPELETPEQHAAWDALKKAFGHDSFKIKAPSIRQVSDKLCTLLVDLIKETDINGDPAFAKFKNLPQYLSLVTQINSKPQPLFTKPSKRDIDMSDETTTFYKKEKDGTYTPIQEYDPNFMDSLPFGIHMVVAEQGSQTRIYNLNPEHIALWASAYLLRNKLEKVVEDIYHPGVIPELETPEQHAAWDALKKAFGHDSFEIKAPSNREVSDKLCELLVELINEEDIKGNPTLAQSFENYQAAVALIK